MHDSEIREFGHSEIRTILHFVAIPGENGRMRPPVNTTFQARMV